MKKIFIFLLCGIKLWANDYQKALEFENKGEYFKAMQIYKKLALQNQILENNSTKNASLQNLKQNSKQENSQLSNSKTTKKQDFVQIALANYLGDENAFNPFGISSHQMNYFMPFSYNFSKVAPQQNRSEIKFQISIKKRLFENLFNLGESYYIAYTQTSWWQAYNHSAPFRENNYKPEFFVNFPTNFEKLPWMQNMRVGILHESNGKSDENLESRSWNRIYLSSVFLKNRFLIAPRIWFRIPENHNDDDNPDIEKYLGNFDLNIAYLGKDFFINTMLRNNLRINSNKGAAQIDIGYDLFDNGIFWYVQYFNGYGESLMDYNKHTHKLSTGFLISY